MHNPIMRAARPSATRQGAGLGFVRLTISLPTEGSLAQDIVNLTKPVEARVRARWPTRL